MYEFDKDIETEAKKLDEKIKKLQEEKAQLKQKFEAEKQKLDLAKKAGLILVNEFKGERFSYSDFKNLLDKYLLTDFERNFFQLDPLAEDDPRRPKRRGRKKKAEIEAENEE